MSVGLRHHLKVRRIILVAFMMCLMTVVTVVTVGGTNAAAREPAVGSGGGGVSGSASDPPVSAAAAPTTFANIDVHGGYVAAGVGLRNRGAGTIVLSGIPAGATVSPRTCSGRFSVARRTRQFQDGSSRAAHHRRDRLGWRPCWNGVTNGYAYRADVTPLVTGNGNYALSGFASGVTNGADPFTTAGSRRSPRAPRSSWFTARRAIRLPG